jgi:hypothetical protein
LQPLLCIDDRTIIDLWHNYETKVTNNDML